MSRGSVPFWETGLVAILDRLLPAGCCSAEQRVRLIQELSDLHLRSKLDALGEFAAGAGHEINNPVATIAGRAQLLLGTEPDPERRLALEIIGGQALRIRDMIGDAMLFARPPCPQPKDVSLGDSIKAVSESLGGAAVASASPIVLQIPDDANVWADPGQLAVLWGSLLRNAVEATSGTPAEIAVTADSVTTEGVGWTRICVADEGPGLTAADREHAFDPFYSSRQAGRGLGFGLSKCWRIVHGHGGRIELKDRSPGVLVEILWPPRTLVDAAIRSNWPPLEPGPSGR